MGQTLSSGTSIQVGCVGSVAWLRVEGAATHENTGSMRDFLHRRFEKGYRTFVVDLENCPGVDSTFIGMLYALAKQVARVDESGTVEVINATGRNERSIRKLGLDHRILIDSDGSRWIRERELVRENLELPNHCPPLSKRERAEMVLEAHEALITANEENEKRFCDVVEFLRQELEEENAAAAGDDSVSATKTQEAAQGGAAGVSGIHREWK